MSFCLEAIPSLRLFLLLNLCFSCLSVSSTCALMVPLCSLYFYPSDTPLVSTSLSAPPFLRTSSGSQLVGGGHGSTGPHQTSHYRWRLLMSVGWSDPAPPARPASLLPRGLCGYIRRGVSIAASAHCTVGGPAGGFGGLDGGRRASGRDSDIEILFPVSTGDGDLPGVQEPPRAAAAAFAAATACALGHWPCFRCCTAPRWCVQVGVRSRIPREGRRHLKGR